MYQDLILMAHVTILFMIICDFLSKKIFFVNYMKIIQVHKEYTKYNMIYFCKH